LWGLMMAVTSFIAEVSRDSRPVAHPAPRNPAAGAAVGQTARRAVVLIGSHTGENGGA
jgi:hypothetical protein